MAPPIDPSDHLTKKLLSRRDEIGAALCTPDFYMVLLLIGLALALAWLVGTLIRRRLNAYLTKNPPKRVDPEFLKKTLSLIAPFLALIFLAIVQPLAENFTERRDVAGAMFQLCAAYLLSKCVFLVVRTRPVAIFIACVIMIVGLLIATGFLHSITNFLDAMQFQFGQFKISMLNIVHGIIILVVVFWVAGVSSRTFESYLRRSSTLNYSARELIVKFFRLIVYFIAIMITLSALGVDLTAFAVFSGAVGVGIGLGLQKITANFLSGITLLLEKSIKLGDLIDINGQFGVVRKLNLRYALLDTLDGREILIPNEELMTNRVISWTYSNKQARVEIKVGIDYDSDPATARKLMLEAVGNYPRAIKSPAPVCYLRDFGEMGYVFRLQFWIADVLDGYYAAQSEAMFAVAEKLHAAGIKIQIKQA